MYYIPILSPPPKAVKGEENGSSEEGKPANSVVLLMPLLLEPEPESLSNEESTDVVRKWPSPETIKTIKYIYNVLPFSNLIAKCNRIWKLQSLLFPIPVFPLFSVAPLRSLLEKKIKIEKS